MVTTLPDWLGTLLWGYRHWTNNGAAVNDSDTTNAVPPLVATFNTNTGKVDLSLVGSPPLGNASVTSLTYAPGYDVTGPAPARLTTTDAAAHTLATIPVPAGSVMLIEARVAAALGVNAGVVNANAPRPGLWVVNAVAWRVGSGSAVVGIADNSLASNFKPFLPAATTSSTGLLGVVASGTNVLLQANGFAVKEAWTTGHTYTAGDGSTTPGDFVTNAGNVYLCTTGGVAGATPPTGTGTGISDGTDVWAYVCAGSTVPVQWTMGAPRVITG